MRKLKRLSRDERLALLTGFAERVGEQGWDAATLAEFDASTCELISCGECPMDKMCPPRGVHPTKTIDEEVSDSE